jgi:RimJ/RimL family protein N-acetyltransferase
MMTQTLETVRLILRPYEPGDRAAFVSLFTDDEVMRYVDRGVLGAEEADALFRRVFTHVYDARAFDVWAVFEKAGGAYAGHAELKPRSDESARPGELEIVYVLGRAHWGRGLATELAYALVAHGLRGRGAARVCATVDPENGPSVRVLEKIGMSYVEEFEDEGGRTLVYAAGGGRPSGESPAPAEERDEDDEDGERRRHGGRDEAVGAEGPEHESLHVEEPEREGEHQRDEGRERAA